jgi:hypothetical protein
MVTSDDDEFAPLDRLVDDSRARSGHAHGVRMQAVALVESMDPFQPPIGQKQRLLLRLGRGSVGRRHTWLRPVVVGALLIGSGAIAAAALTNWPAWLLGSCRTLITPRSDSSPAERAQAARAGVAPDSPAAEPIPSTAQRRPTVVHRLSVEVHSRRPLVEAPSDDPSLVVDATRALRVDRDPKLARVLASRYLERYPGGALAEEALAVSIEAAIDHHDAEALALSARYLLQFPGGSFRGLAERTLTSPTRR